jgi:Flp pilus assembly protein TadD
MWGLSAIARSGALCGALLLAACSASDSLDLALTTDGIPPADQRPSDEPLALGKMYYDRGSYGLSERHFRTAVEANAQSADAWLGLAASYDRLSRFDLAERAYNRTIALVGRTPEVLNNMGYHYLLRGDLRRARELLSEAAQLDPNNPKIQGNLYLLETWKTGE